jgi:hypothetical protein
LWGDLLTDRKTTSSAKLPSPALTCLSPSQSQQNQTIDIIDVDNDDDEVDVESTTPAAKKCNNEQQAQKEGQ